MSWDRWHWLAVLGRPHQRLCLQETPTSAKCPLCCCFRAHERIDGYSFLSRQPAPQQHRSWFEQMDSLQWLMKVQVCNMWQCLTCRVCGSFHTVCQPDNKSSKHKIMQEHIESPQQLLRNPWLRYLAQVISPVDWPKLVRACSSCIG